MIKTIIVACAKDDDDRSVIGLNNNLPWDKIPEDLKHFRKSTLNHPVVMGMNTWKSLNKIPLKNRLNVIVTRSEKQSWRHESIEGQIVYFVGSVFMAIHLLEAIGSINNAQFDEIFIIGGGQIYQSALESNLVDKIIMTQIHKQYEGDTFFPELDDSWLQTETRNYKDFDIATFVKKLI